MYTITAGQNIEFYYKDDTLLDLVRMESAFKARAAGDVDGMAFTKDEFVLGYDILKDILIDIFFDLEKQMVGTMFLHDDTTRHSISDYYSGFFIWDNDKYSESLLVGLDRMIMEAAKYGVLGDWYRKVGLIDDAATYILKYTDALTRLHNFAFVLRKPDGGAFINFTNDIMTDKITVEIHNWPDSISILKENS